MKSIFLAALALVTLAVPASAACYGSGSFSSCSDSSGNSYTINRMGNSTYMNGFNSNTGSTWSQNSRRMGNSTYTNGFDSQGRSWNSTTSQFGTYGTDTRGKSFFCGPLGCY